MHAGTHLLDVLQGAQLHQQVERRLPAPLAHPRHLPIAAAGVARLELYPCASPCCLQSNQPVAGLHTR